MNDIERQVEVIRSNAVEVIEERELREKIRRSLATGQPLRVKYGIDPTAPEIHLGHTVPIRKLRDFQNLGHQVFFLIGDFTARIGDPTGRKETRPILSAEEIAANMARYREQAGRILDLDRTSFVFNSSWLADIRLQEVVRLCSLFTVAQILEREDFTVRYRDGKPIFLHEFLYPLLQGYDSVALKADVEIGATEQKFNLLAGRTMQEAFGQEKQVVLTMPILVGTDGKQKMSKTYRNHIPLDARPEDMFGKVMSVPDAAMPEYFRFLTDIPQEEYTRRIAASARDAKAFLAAEIVASFYGRDAAARAEEEFNAVFRDGGVPADIPECALAADDLQPDGTIPVARLLTLAGLAASASEARRLVRQNAVEIGGQRVSDPLSAVTPADGQIVRAGKRRFCRIRLR